jgi:phage terminase small subunit
MGSKAELTPKQKLFVAEYLKDLNATQAAIRAGYSPKTAEQQGHQLLKKPSVSQAVGAKAEKRLEKLDISAERILEELAKLAFANMADYITITKEGEAFVDLSKLTREQAAAIQEISVDESAGGAGDGRRERVQRTRFKLAPKIAALELLGKHKELFTEKIKVTADDELLQRLTAGRKRVAAVQHG